MNKNRKIKTKDTNEGQVVSARSIMRHAKREGEEGTTARQVKKEKCENKPPRIMCPPPLVTQLTSIFCITW
jgi:hypothetical protein